MVSIGELFKKIAFFILLLWLAGILFFLVVYFLQNFIIIVQEIDYYFYKSSNMPVQQLVVLEEESRQEYIALGPVPIKTNKSRAQKKDNSTIKANKDKQGAKKAIPSKNYWISIPKIGVDTPILRYGSLTKRMYKGVAIVTEFGRPNEDSTKKFPTILVSHRFGYVWWTPKYRRLNSFYNLDKLKIDDTIFIYWQEKLYKYRVTKTEVSSLITEYNHDLILYTCVNYFNPKRIIVYADFVDE